MADVPADTGADCRTGTVRTGTAAGLPAAIAVLPANTQTVTKVANFFFPFNIRHAP